jgi:UDP-2,3-diacylglucosamine hydrolase
VSAAPRFARPRTLDVGAMEAPVVVVADVHLSAKEPDVAARFASFLASCEGRGGWLVLLGDLFDWWVGSAQARRPFEADVIARLARVAASGVRLAFVAGNRDFAFEGAPGLAMERWPDAAKARWGSRTALLTHGDLLCTADTGYLALRSVLRSPPFAAGRKALPFRVTSYVAQGLRGVSMRSGR